MPFSLSVAQASSWEVAHYQTADHCRIAAQFLRRAWKQVAYWFLTAIPKSDWRLAQAAQQILMATRQVQLQAGVQWRLLIGFEQVCATTAKAMLLHVLKERLVKVPNSLLLRALSLLLRNFDWMAQYSPRLVRAIRSMPSSRDGRSSRFRHACGTSCSRQTCSSSLTYSGASRNRAE